MTYPNDDPRIDAGYVHTEFLQELIPRVRKVSSGSRQSIDICLPVANGLKKRLLRFVIFVGTDAVSGTIAGGGVGGAIVGGHASYGADQLIFGGGQVSSVISGR